MVELAKKNNVQLFITTHSYYDALRYFKFAFENEEDRRKNFRCYLLTNNDGIIDANVTDVEKILRVIYPH